MEQLLQDVKGTSNIAVCIQIGFKIESLMLRRQLTHRLKTNCHTTKLVLKILLKIGILASM